MAKAQELATWRFMALLAQQRCSGSETRLGARSCTSTCTATWPRAMRTIPGILPHGMHAQARCYWPPPVETAAPRMCCLCWRIHARTRPFQSLARPQWLLGCWTRGQALCQSGHGAARARHRLCTGGRLTASSGAAGRADPSPLLEEMWFAQHLRPACPPGRHWRCSGACTGRTCGYARRSAEAWRRRCRAGATARRPWPRSMQ
mmetsp:Transcript_148912/g.478430  ORF Transcript_148912/g.478430 Transcript_148912/m.478430 type:complete len:204 (+) Transcript_148912:839-1450(+)